MVIGTIKDAARYEGLCPRIAEALHWLQTTDVNALQEGKNPIRDEEIFCNVNAYHTTVKEERVWEGHRKYIDIHFMIKGEEIIAVSPITAMKVKQDYNAETDFIEFEGNAQQHILLQEGMFLIAFPEDIHKTALQVTAGTDCAVRKGIMKVFL
ncbi:MAG: YhcH/YjgK/YiaL family protein [Treponema sp.]|uniref:YhcH/YjgK/YiaL family protein n=1 Tax=Treponema sp. TaxID=166 RepID=UPI003FA23CE2